MALGVLEVLLALEDEAEPLAERVGRTVRDVRVGVDVVTPCARQASMAATASLRPWNSGRIP